MALDVTDNDVYNALVAFIGLIVPTGTPVERGQTNRVPMPAVPCVILTTIGAPDRIGTNAESTQAIMVDGEITGFEALVEADFTYTVQADFYGPDAESWAMATELLWRSKLAWYGIPDGMKPLYSDGRMQLPLVGAEKQWIQRWTLTLVLDYQPTWTQETEAATSATVIPEPIDVFYPPGSSGVLATGQGQLIVTGENQPIEV
jgi:hypothetical protein